MKSPNNSSASSKDWLILFYIAGDLDSPRRNAIEEDLCEILAAGTDENTRILIQYDCLECCFRYVLEPNSPQGCTVESIRNSMAWPRELVVDRSRKARKNSEDISTQDRARMEKWCSYRTDGKRFNPASYIKETEKERHRPVEALGRINSGSASELENFIAWGLTKAGGSRVALVIVGKDRLEPRRRDGDDGRLPQIFTLCRDDSTRNHLSFVDFSIALQRGIEKARFPRKWKFDILAIDSAQSQFMELAHELEDNVKILIGPQTFIPRKGWDYKSVLEAWRKVDASLPREQYPIFVAKAIVSAINTSYKKANEGLEGRSAYAVSAIDLSQLPDMATNFDSGCMTFIQSLGEGAIWDARETLRRFLAELKAPARTKQLAGAAPADRTRTPADASIENQYDCGVFFRSLALVMTIKANLAVFDWLIWDLSQHGRHEFNEQFWCEVTTRMQAVQAPAVPLPAGQTGPFDPWQSLRSCLDHKRPKNQSSDQRCKWFQQEGKKLVEKARIFAMAILTEAHFGRISPQEIDGLLQRCKGQDSLLERVIKKDVTEFPSLERRKSFWHMNVVREAANRLAAQAGKLNSFFAPGEPHDAKTTRKRPLVIASECTDDAEKPNWTGLSVYRPDDLDSLMNPDYRHFSFHKRVHWAALLGAVYLIEATPSLAMWRLISGLISRGSGSTRRDLLDHLSGSKSVIWGMENQFRILAPSPTITLSLEHWATQNRNFESNSGRGGLLKRPQRDPWGNPMAPTMLDGSMDPSLKEEENQYLVRLESHRKGAVIYEHYSWIRNATITRILEEIRNALGSSTAGGMTYGGLQTLGGILGDEVLQDLARTLRAEQRSIAREMRQRNGAPRKRPSSRSPQSPSLHEDDDDDAEIHLQLNIPRELMMHPWELMCIRERMLGFNFALGRRVYMDSSTYRGELKREKGVIRPLLIIPDYAGGNHLANTAGEGEEIKNLFDSLQEKRTEIVKFEEKDILKGESATWMNFRMKLYEGNYDIIHFAGHATFVKDDPDSSAWVFRDGIVTAREIRNTLLHHSSPPWLVYANACKAGTGGFVANASYQGEVFGLATAFIGHGVSAYVAPLWDIGDLPAKKIAVEFYKQLLLHGASLGEALLRAKRKMREELHQQRKKGQAEDLSWAGVVLFGDASGDLTQALAGKESDARDEDGGEAESDSGNDDAKNDEEDDDASPSHNHPASAEGAATD